MNLRKNLVAVRKQIQGRYAALKTAFAERARAVESKDEEEGSFEKVHEFHFGEDEKPSPEAARVREDAARDAYERAPAKRRSCEADSTTR
jgi:hypothetical protein